MKNRDLIAILSALPLDADVLIHGEVTLNEDEDVCVDVGPPGEHPGKGPNWAMQATTFIGERR